MSKLKALLARYPGPAGCAAIAAGLFVLSVLLWLARIRPEAAKTRSVKVSDDYTAFTAVERDVEATFTTSFDVQNLLFVFGAEGGQPQGAIWAELQDAATGEVLARSEGVMGNIVPGQYTALGFNALADSGNENRQYRVALRPQYETEARLTLGHSAAAIEGETLVVDGEAVQGFPALYVSGAPVGRFLSLFYFSIVSGLTALLCLGWLLAVRKKGPSPAALALVLVLGFGALYSAVLPPFAAPDEEFHINQSFTIASRWANRLSKDEWVMGEVPIFYSYRRTVDFNSVMEDSRTTVFTWKEYAYHLGDTVSVPLGDHAWVMKAQADDSDLLYYGSALAVFLGFALGRGFAATLFLGRMANLVLFALLAALAVKWAPFGKKVFFAAALLPMTLHLAASFSRDSLLLGLAFAFTALALRLAYGTQERLGWRQLAPFALLGLALAPSKVVYAPLTALCFLIPHKKLGGKRRALALQGGFLALALAVTVAANTAILASSAKTQDTATGQEINSQILSDYEELLEITGGESVEVRGHEEAAIPAAAPAPAAEDAGETDAAAIEAERDRVTFTARYLLAHPAKGLLLLVNSAVGKGDHYVKTLVGGNLSYYSLDLAWAWVVALYGLLAFAAIPAAGETVVTGRERALCALVALAVAGLVVLGCITWTPTYYTEIYGLQGRYFLPALPLALLALRPAKLRAERPGPGFALTASLLTGAVLLNAVLAVVAR